MRDRRRFAVALAASVLAHLAVLLGLGGSSAASDGAGALPSLTAQLVAPAAAPAPVAPVVSPRPAPRPRPRRVKTPKAAPVAPATALAPETDAAPPEAVESPEPEPAADAPAEAVAQADEAQPEPPVEAPGDAPEATAAAGAPGGSPDQWVDLPRSVRIHYEVTMGDNGFVLGRTLQEFHQDGARYTMRSTATTTGLANLFKPARVVNHSVGETVKGHLRPLEYRAERGKGKTEAARFNWEESRLAIAGGREFELQGMTQDLLSVFFQLALMVPTDSPVISLPVVTGRKLEQYDFEVVGEVTIDTPLGPRRTLHLRTRRPDSRESTEVWLSLDDARLPVKIRHVDRKGDVFDQVAHQLDVESQQELPQERAP